MALKIRLRRQGRVHRPFYRLVVADATMPRDGKYVESLGWYNPVETEEDKVLYVKPDRIEYWLNQGAQATEKAEALMAKAAPEVMKKHKAEALARKIAKRKAKKAK